MGPKKGKDKKKKKEKEKPVVLLKSDYTSKIASRNAVLAAARKRIQKVEDAYFATEKNYEQTQEDMADVLKYLQHEIEENELEIAAFDEKIGEYKNEISQIDKYYKTIFTQMETEYEEKEKALHYQIQQNTAKLSAFEEVKQMREEYLKKKELMEMKMLETQARHQQEIYEAEKQAIIKQDTMQKEMEINLVKLATDFRQATDVAIGETTYNLIKENIKLGNNLTCMQEIFEKARDSYYKIFEKEKQYRYNAELFDEEQHLIQQKYTEQISKIDNLLKHHEELYEKIRMSERLIKDNRRLLRQIAEKECILKDKIAELLDLQRVLSENEEMFNSIKNIFNSLRKAVINLEVTLFEAAKRAKQGVEIENITRLTEEQGENFFELDKEEQEETLKEYKYKTRETLMEEIVEKLSTGLLSDSDMPLITFSSEFQLESHPESTVNVIEPIK